ncbi:MAG: hypothetical protein QXY52_02865 [Conexivisphaerales archaeon]
MLQVTSKDVNGWNTVIKAASALLEEIALEFHPDKITMRNMDPSHIAMLNLEWLAQSFDGYVCDGEYIITLRLEDLANVIKRTSKGDTLEISLGEGNSVVIKVKNGYQREFTLHSLESSHTDVPLPKVNFTAKVIITLKGFRDALADIATVSDQIVMKGESGSLTLSGSSEYGNVKVAMTTGTSEIKDIDIANSSTASYSVEYLEKFTRSLSTSTETISIEFGNRLPMKVEAPIDQKGSRLEYYLAPRVE